MGTSNNNLNWFISSATFLQSFSLCRLSLYFGCDIIYKGSHFLIYSISRSCFISTWSILCRLLIHTGRPALTRHDTTRQNILYENVGRYRAVIVWTISLKCMFKNFVVSCRYSLNPFYKRVASESVIVLTSCTEWFRNRTNLWGRILPISASICFLFYSNVSSFA